jgi:hypothetical protein
MSTNVICVPLSVVIVVGMPKPATRVARVSVYGLASMLQNGPSFTHLVNLSMAVYRYMWPSEEARRGPTRSMCMWRICLPSQGCCGVELLAVCRPFPIGTVGRLGTWLPCLCPYPSRQSMEIPSIGSSYAVWATLWIAWKITALSITRTSVYTLHVHFLAVERDTPCTYILGGGERYAHSQCMCMTLMPECH